MDHEEVDDLMNRMVHLDLCVDCDFGTEGVYLFRLRPIEDSEDTVDLKVAFTGNGDPLLITVVVDLGDFPKDVPTLRWLMVADTGCMFSHLAEAEGRLVRGCIHPVEWLTDETLAGMVFEVAKLSVLDRRKLS